MSKVLSDTDITLKLIELQMKQIEQADSIYMKSLQLKEQRLRSMLAFKLEEEPLRIFKKKHKKWEDEVSAIEEEISEHYQKITEFMEEVSGH